MTLQDVVIFEPKTDEETGVVAQEQHEITLILENIHFVYQETIGGNQKIVYNPPVIMVTPTKLDEDKLREAGLVEFQSPEGLKSWANPKKVLFFTSPQLGIYLLLFAAGNRLGVQATRVELEEALNI